ncbi:MAG: hypothetical protein JXA41_02380 [Deltaproteobacteria bacterium]|nr:hypothetical protein [Deltaproteobacteria bacterium]
MATKKNRLGKNTRSALIFMAAAVLYLLVSTPLGHAAVKHAGYQDGALSLEATNATVGELLETIARTAGIDIFIARGYQPPESRKTISISGESIEDVLRSILRGYNYAAIYIKEGDQFRIAAVKIYPEGQRGGEVVPLFSSGRPPVHEEKGRRGETVSVMVSSTGDLITRGQLDKKGVLAPSQTSISGNTQGASESLHTPWFALQMQLESQETAKFQEILLLQKKVETAEDPALKQSLSMIYADEVAKYYAVKKANLNKIEALKRITQFKDMTGQ